MAPLRASTIITETFNMTTSTLIPDADLNGIVQTITPATTLGSLIGVTVTLETSGGWNGDLYAYLWHDGVLRVLVNRTGRTLAKPDGAGTSGMTLTFSDTATMDVHTAVGALEGIFQPDFRNVHPLATLDTSPRSGALADYYSTSPGGAWRLFIADVATGDEATLVGWSISLTGAVAVPEPSMMGIFALVVMCASQRSRSSRSRVM